LDSIEISDSEVYSNVDRHINAYINYYGSPEKVEEYSQKSINTLRDEFRSKYKEEFAIERVKRALIEKVKVTSSDVRSFYKKIPEDELPFIPTTVEVAIFTSEPKASSEETDNIKSRLREYSQRVLNGETTFSALARTYSHDTNSALQGGDLGFMGRGQLVPEFAAAAFDLNDTRRVSPVVETEYGFHIIQLIERRGDRINVRHILLRPRITKEAITEATLRLDSIRNRIVAGDFSFEEGALYFSADKDTRNNKGILVNSPNVNNPAPTTRTGTARFEMSELPPEIAIAVNTMKVGEISMPFTMINPKTSREMVAIVKLNARVEGHKANLSDDFYALRAQVEEAKSEEILNKWIAKKRKETYIRIKDDWKNCDFEHDGWLQ